MRSRRRNPRSGRDPAGLATAPPSSGCSACSSGRQPGVRPYGRPLEGRQGRARARGHPDRRGDQGGRGLGRRWRPPRQGPHAGRRRRRPQQRARRLRRRVRPEAGRADDHHALRGRLRRRHLAGRRGPQGPREAARAHQRDHDARHRPPGRAREVPLGASPRTPRRRSSSARASSARSSPSGAASTSSSCARRAGAGSEHGQGRPADRQQVAR